MYACIRKCALWRNHFPVRRAIPLALVTAAPLLSACTSAPVQLPTLGYYEANGTDPTAKLMFPNTDTDRWALPSHFYLHPTPTDIAGLYSEIYGRLGKPTDGSGRKRVRNTVQNELLRRSDQACGAYQTRIIHGYVVGDAAVKGAQGALGIVKTITAPFEAVSNAFGAVSTGVTSFVNSDILQWKLIEDTNRRILTSRRNFRNLIRQAQFKPIDEYDISQAIYDAERYHELCNFSVALVSNDDLIASKDTEQIGKPPPEAATTTKKPAAEAANATPTKPKK